VQFIEIGYLVIYDQARAPSRYRDSRLTNDTRMLVALAVDAALRSLPQQEAAELGARVAPKSD